MALFVTLRHDGQALRVSLVEAAPTMKWTDRIGCRLKLHDLHIFMTVAETGSMGKAAERLALSQPSVSKAGRGDHGLWSRAAQTRK